MTRNSIPAVAAPALAPLALADDMPVIQAHWQGTLQIGMAAGAVALTAVTSCSWALTRDQALRCAG